MSNLGELNKTILLEVVGNWLGLSAQERRQWASKDTGYNDFIDNIRYTSEAIDPIQNIVVMKGLTALCVSTLELIEEYMQFFNYDKVLKIVRKLMEEL